LVKFILFLLLYEERFLGKPFEINLLKAGTVRSPDFSYRKT